MLQWNREKTGAQNLQTQFNRSKEIKMFTNRLFRLLMIAAIVMITACTPQVAAETPLPQIVNTPTAAPSQNTTSPCPCFEGLSSGLENATQARIRAVSQVMGAPTIDVYVNGMPALNGGIAQGNIGAGLFSGWLYVAPGTYSIALVPHGGTLDEALFAPTDVKAEAGHRYTVAAMGQLADNDIHPLVVDETALIADANPNPTDTITIDINNLIGADSITEECDGKPAAENIQYGEARVFLCPSGTILFKSVANAKTPGVLWDGTDDADPGTSYAEPWFGPYPAENYDAVGNISQGTSELNMVDFLAGYSGRNVNDDDHLLEFNTLLKLIDKAGLRDQLVNSGPYFFMAPTDEAFSALPQADLDALLNDPQALLKLFDAHIVDGYYPFGSLSGAVYGHSDRVVTNRLGQELRFRDDYLNDQPIGANYTVGNGNRVQIIYNLLPSK
jgi:hypothetical protein